MKIYIAIFALLILLSASFQYGTIDYYTITVEDKERISTGSGDSLSHKYLIFTNERVFKNTDSLFHWKFSSSDFQHRMKKGAQYRIKTYGWRVPFLSMYENIVEYQAI